MAVKLESIRLQDWRGGLNRSLSDFEIGENELWTAINCLVDSAAIRKRPGYKELNSVAIGGGADVLSVYEFYEGGNSHILINCGEVIYEIDSDGDVTPIVEGLESGYPVSYATYGAVVYMSNGYNSVWKWDGVRADTKVDVNSPNTGAILYVASTTGFSNGKTVIIDQGGTREETKVILSKDGTSLTMTENLTHTHLAADEDAVWSAATELATLPKAKYLIVHYDKLFYVSTDLGVNYVEFSQAALPEVVEDDAFFIVYTDDGDKLTGVSSLFGYLMLFKNLSTHRLQGARKDQLILSDNLVCAHPRVGCVAHNTIVHVPGGILFLSNDGAQFTDSAAIAKQSDKVDYFLAKIADANKQNSCAFWDGKNYRPNYPTGGNSLPNETLCFNLQNKAWTLFDYGMNAYCRARNGVIYGAGKDGYVYLIDQGLSDAGAAIEMRAETKIFDFGAPYRTDIFRKAGINTYNGKATLDFILAVDRGQQTCSKSFEAKSGETYWGEHNWAISSGTVTVASGSPIVTGDGDVDWAEVAAEDSFQIDGDDTVYTVKTKDSATQITLYTNYTIEPGGEDGANKTYCIWNEETLFWTEPLPSYEEFSLPKRLKGKNIQVQFREKGAASTIAIYGCDLRALPSLGR